MAWLVNKLFLFTEEGFAELEIGQQTTRPAVAAARKTLRLTQIHETRSFCVYGRVFMPTAFPINPFIHSFTDLHTSCEMAIFRNNCNYTATAAAMTDEYNQWSIAMYLWTVTDSSLFTTPGQQGS